MMMRFFKGLWLLPLMALVASASQASAQSTRLHSAAITSADGHHLLWKVEGERGTAYLVGSLHFGTPDMYPLPAEITQAYEDSRALVVEINLTALDPAQMAKTVAAKAMFAGDMTLEKAVTPETWKELNRAMEKFGMPAKLVEQQKPWFASMTLTSLALRRYGFKEDLGIDDYFMRQALGKKPIMELETFQRQLDFLDGFSAADQEEMLKETFQDLDKGRKFLDEMLKAWRMGDAQKIDALMNEELRNGSDAGERMYQVLVVQRNKAMADKLDNLLKRGGVYFVVLGSAHFVGEDGIVALLRAKGYQVQQH